ncbi:carboxypeptidase-like regulatory domain-containing protein, partial [Streptomyces prunicolor]|uniref:carboxypeptidase-like regulatory domain-containing protein n=1 Tax=Streptomyces prunicolor TaxID=67348 RepID=UPI0033FA360B
MALALLRRWLPQGGSATAAGLSLPLPPGAGGLGREIVDPMGSPMASAEVTVTALDSHRVAASGTTDPYGFFLAALPPGRYGLLVSAQGLQPHQETVEIVAGIAESTERIWLQPGRAQELPPPGTWLFDPPHTAIRFIAKHLWGATRVADGTLELGVLA